MRLAKDEATPKRKRVSKLRTFLSAAGEVVIESKRIAPNTERNYLRSLRHVVAATDDRVVSKGTEIRNLHKLIVFARLFSNIRPICEIDPSIFNAIRLPTPPTNA